MKKSVSILLLLACSLPMLASDDPEPPGRGVSAKTLKGKWTGDRRLFRGNELKLPALGYQFDGEKYTYSSGLRIIYGGKMSLDAKSKPAVLELSRDNTTVVQRFAVKIEKGELYLVPKPTVGEADFTGKTTSVMILKREEKK